MPEYARNVGAAPHHFGGERAVFRGSGWTQDTVGRRGDVFPVSQDELLRYRHKLEGVEPAAYPQAPDVAAPPPPPPAFRPVSTREEIERPTDYVNVDVYHTGGGWYQLPNGEKVQGRSAAYRALGVELG